MRWIQSPTALALHADGRILWQHNHDPVEGKPYFHPVTDARGATLTMLRPADHPWHRAIWFSWKFINGLNYWEEDANGVSAGRTALRRVTVEPRADFSARLDLELAYHPPDTAPVLTESRRLEISAPAADGGFQIEWASQFRAGPELVRLERTPVAGQADGQSWGGYAGLSVRLSDAAAGWQFHDSAGRRGTDNIRAQRAAWVEYGAPAGGSSVRVTDNARNPRHPTAWYVWSEGMHYFSPAVLYHEALTIAPGATLSLRYQIAVRP